MQYGTKPQHNYPQTGGDIINTEEQRDQSPHRTACTGKVSIHTSGFQNQQGLPPGELEGCKKLSLHP